MRGLLPSKFRVRERILTGIAVALAGVAFYLISTAQPRAAAGVWIQWQFLGAVAFVAIGGRDRAFFTGLYCLLLSGVYFAPIAIAYAWTFQWAAFCFGAFMLAFSVLIPVTFAWYVTLLIRYLERKFSR